MMTERDKQFTFSWRALQLLGKSLYSNAWSAISELVANGFDAGADTVYVYIEYINKKNATIEIIDNGSGMSEEEINTYVKVGYDRRQAFYRKTGSYDMSENITGRKGIGKLAALYLSDDYFIQTKTQSEISTWHLLRKEIVEDDELDNNPRLLRESNETVKDESKRWKFIKTGTMLKLHNVDLEGLGAVAFDSLSYRLANHFLTDGTNRSIKLCIVKNIEDKTNPEFKDVEKAVGFKNLILITENFPDAYLEPEEIRAIRNSESKVGISVLNGRHIVEKDVVVKQFSEFSDKANPVSGVYEAMSVNGEKVRIRYELTGWIGLHSTIDSKIAQKNDSSFVKNRYYNPAKLRLYVRGKLADENFLSQLRITQAFINYIEGDISFNLLDDDRLPDIATSNRQGFNELDQRIDLLRNIVTPIVRKLITVRNDISKELREEEKRIKSSAKNAAFQRFSKELDDLNEIKEADKTSLKHIFVNQLQGDVSVEAKSKFKIFLSHSRKDSRFTDFIYKLLEHKGADKDDFFYTSADDCAEKYDDNDALSAQIKRNITDDYTLIAYFVSPNFKGSEYCLFEAGAGWATRSVGDYKLVALKFNDIPQYLTNGKNEITLYDDDSVQLNWKNYSALIIFLNKLISHINHGREINGDHLIPLFPTPVLPDRVELSNTSKEIKDYMDKDFVSYWEHYISPNLDEYLEQVYDEGKSLE